MGKISALFVLADGVEELEAVAPLDVLRRVGVDCVVASCTSDRLVTGRNGIRLEADVLMQQQRDRVHDALVIPGGPSTAALRKDARVLALVRDHRAADKLVAAICAAPLVLLDAGVLPGPSYTAHASVAEELPELDATRDVVIDGTVITSRGAGTAVAFGLAIVEALLGRQRALAVAQSIHATGV